MPDDMMENVTKRQHWLRIFFTLLFMVALYVTGIVLLVVVIAQALFSLFSGADNPNLRRLGASLSEYVSQVLAYATYNSDHRPFPFSAFPAQDNDNREDL
ncbi:MAG: DUF4389 domain-containing protein [Pseudohongiellaceae bacterium]